jgi:hypothetical protein
VEDLLAKYSRIIKETQTTHSSWSLRQKWTFSLTGLLIEHLNIAAHPPCAIFPSYLVVFDPFEL